MKKQPAKFSENLVKGYEGNALEELPLALSMPRKIEPSNSFYKEVPCSHYGANIGVHNVGKPVSRVLPNEPEWT